MADLKISQLTALTTPALEDLLAIVDDPSGTPETKKIALSNLLLDENDMASNSQTQGATQRSILTYVGGLDGWQTRGLEGVTVTRQSTDNPTVVLRFNADVTDYIWKGTRIKATENSIVHYFIVSADPSFSGGNTDVTCLSEIDISTPTQAENLIGTGTISAVAYAPPKTYPKGFPIDEMSWTPVTTFNTDITQSTADAFWKDTGLDLILHIGPWRIRKDLSIQPQRSSTTGSGIAFGRLTLSTDTSSETIVRSTYEIGISAGTNTSNPGLLVYGRDNSFFNYEVASKTTLNILVQRANPVTDNVRLRHSTEKTGFVFATSTLL